MKATERAKKYLYNGHSNRWFDKSMQLVLNTYNDDVFAKEDSNSVKKTESNVESEAPRGICVRGIPAKTFIAAYTDHLKNSDKSEHPIWADTVKTGDFKELAPYGDDWYYIRAASIARKVYLRPGVRVGTLQK